jgi:hypothetical protein
MKSLLRYLIEGLKTDVKKWLNNVYKSQQSLVKNNKLQQIDVDVKQLNKPQQPFLLEDFASEPIVKQLIGNRLTGFTVVNQMIRNPKQYIYDKTKEMKPECMPYWYSNGNNIYFVGICIYDKSISYIDNYVHLIAIESSLIVSESAPLNVAILNDFIKLINKEGNYQGISVKPLHPKMKASFMKLGFNVLKENKEILTYKL